ncbi:MAG: hypothetical protein KIT33_13785 [Candidatus Kapabacteria bacterium]|nr:hypothetical protein [Ignavibacteriota bacterium]MCW5886036.1 hypothetical protein [Candidatus Kapabacteria bacterium]
MLKKIYLITTVVGIFLIISSTNLFGQVPYYVIDTTFSPCYQLQFTECNDCDSTIVTETILIEGCPCIVTYKITNCNCPEPRTFVEILYIRVNINFPPPCVVLINKVHPDFPELNMDNYQNLMKDIYDDIFNRLFDAVSNNYPCPEMQKSFYYLEATCKMVCTVGLSAPGQPDALLWLPKYCTPTGCCTTEYQYCKNPDGSIVRSVIRTGGGVCEGTQPSEPCPIPGSGPTAQQININGIYYNVTWVNASECTAVCIPIEW